VSIDLAMDEEEKNNPFVVESGKPMDVSLLNESRMFLDITLDFGVQHGLNVQESKMPLLLQQKLIGSEV